MQTVPKFRFTVLIPRQDSVSSPVMYSAGMTKKIHLHPKPKVNPHVGLCLWVWAGACTTWKTLGVPIHHSLTYSPEIRSLIEHGPRLATSKPLWLSCLCSLQCWSYRSYRAMPSLFHKHWGFKLRSLCFETKPLLLTELPPQACVLFFLSFDFPRVMDNPLIPKIGVDSYIMKSIRVQFMLFCFHWKIYFLTPSVLD